MPLKEQVIEAVEALAPELIEVARFLHQNPELAFEERKAKACLTKVLERYDFQIEEGIAGLETAFLASLGKGSPTLAFLAEYDALPEIGHACGHNLIAASSLGATLALRPLLQDLEGTILLIGCPAEEKGGGKIPLIRAGIFDRIDCALLIHPDNRTIIASRSLALRRLSAEFFGKAAHAAASPHLGVNALDAVILSFAHVNALRQQLRPDARIHGIITHGGRAANIIPDYAAARFIIRALDMAYLEELHRKIEGCFRGAAWGTGAKLKLSVEGDDYEPLLPNESLAGLFKSHLEALGVPVEEAPEDEGLGSTDVGNVSRVVPALQPSVAICRPPIACHSPEFAQAAGSGEGERVMLLSAKALALTALDLLTDREKLARVRAEFEWRRGGKR